MSKSVLLQSSIAKKYWMALTGLFLCLFLVGHLLGNLQLLLPVSEASDSFNLYAKFMTTNPVVKILSYITYFSILFHIVDGILITIQNKKARPVSYAFNKPSANSSWTSRNMGVLGTVLLFFLIVHMRSFWYEMHFGEMPTTLIDGQEFKDLYLITTQAFEQLWYVIFYVVCMV
ncbi:MAG: succinate dehydrogenase, partial [Bacteroidota bacterium]|nr:succinate dehydrogenase [Bacteroidota bacterium]